MTPELHEIGMPDDAIGDVDGEIIGRVACASLRYEDKIPGTVIRRTGLCDRYEGHQATRGYCGSEEVFHCESPLFPFINVDRTAAVAIRPRRGGRSREGKGPAAGKPG